MLDAAQRLVAQLRAQHAYTDTATFTCVPHPVTVRTADGGVSPLVLLAHPSAAVTHRLKCGDCGRALKGEKEAREHAASSGHTSFTEYDG